MKVQRLAKLEEALTQLRGRRCPLCKGHPLVIVREVWETDADGPGLGRCDVRIEDAERFSSDLRCRLCGVSAIQVILQDLKGITCDRTDRS
jgi:hypothetical protein